MAYNRYSNSSAGSFLWFIVAAVIVIGGIAWQVSGGANDKAEAVAKDKGGFSKVTSVKRDWTTLCNKNTTGFEVKGIRDDREAKVTVCVSAAPWGSYIR